MNDVNPSTSADWSSNLIDLLTRQQDIVTRLGSLAAHQKGLIEESKAEPLLGLLGQRQKLIDEFTSQQADLADLTADLDTRLATIETPHRDEIRSLISEIETGLDHVMKQDARDQRALEEARDRIRRELAATGASQQARQAYTPPPTAGSQYADRKG